MPTKKKDIAQRAFLRMVPQIMSLEEKVHKAKSREDLYRHTQKLADELLRIALYVGNLKRDAEAGKVA